MVEYHVDTLDLFQDEVNNDASILFGGKLSVRLKEGERPLFRLAKTNAYLNSTYSNQTMREKGC